MHIVTVECISCIFVVPVSLIKPVVWACFNGEASSIKIELLNIYGNSGGYLHQMISSISLQRRLATVGFTGTNGIQSHSPAHRIIADCIHDTQFAYNHGIYGRHGQGKVGQRFSAQFSFSLPIWTSVSHFCTCSPLLKTLYSPSFLLKIIFTLYNC